MTYSEGNSRYQEEWVLSGSLTSFLAKGGDGGAVEIYESVCVLFRAGTFLCTSGLVNYYGSEHRVRSLWGEGL